MPRQPKPRRLSVVRYQLPDGTRCTKSTPGAICVRTTTETWYATLPGTRKPTSLKTADIGQAWVNLNRLLKEQADRRAGIRTDAHDVAALPLSEHLDAWIAAVLAGGCSETQAALMRGRMDRLAAAAGWKRLGDLTSERCLSALSRLHKEEYYHGTPRKKGKANRRGRSAQTRNYYLSHAKQFARWCADTGRLPRNPLSGLRPISTEADRRHDRRCPEDAEIVALFAYLDTATTVTRGMDARCRAVAYKVAMATGFRAKEVRALRRESFNLEEGQVTCPASYSKRTRCDTQDLPTWLLLELREYFGSGGKTWERFPKHFGRVLKPDLAGAGIAYSVPGPDGPLFFDAHALRVWYITALANQPGISPKTLMELARHSTPTLTLRTYAKAKRHSLKAAVESIPNPAGKPVDAPDTMRA